MSQETGFAIPLTGLPASGKTSLAVGLAAALKEGAILQITDSDALRQVLTSEPTYSREERHWYCRVMAYVGRLLTQNGTNVVFAATADRRL